LNFSLWILFVLDYLLLEITTPLIVYIWRRHGGTCKFGFEFHWDVNFFIIMWPLHNESYCNISMKNGSNVIILKWKVKVKPSQYEINHFIMTSYIMQWKVKVKASQYEFWSNNIKFYGMSGDSMIANKIV
jgi:hypothetical protein